MPATPLLHPVKLVGVMPVQVTASDAPTEGDYGKNVTLTIDGQSVTVPLAEPLKDAQGNIVALTTTEISALTSAQVAGINTTNVGVLTTTQVTALTTTQVAAMTNDAMDGVPSGDNFRLSQWVIAVGLSFTFVGVVGGFVQQALETDALAKPINVFP